ncbi:MAG: hypothetical protein ACPG5B_07240 [Chitinophagales bacterium]
MNIRTIIVFFVISFSFLFSSFIFIEKSDKMVAFAEKSTSKQNIKITKTKTTSGFDALDISFDIHSDLESFIKVLVDVDSYHEWVYGCSFAKELKATNPENTAYHTLLDFPFPFADRAVYVETKKYYLADSIFVAESNSNPKLFEKTKNVIVKDYFSQWKVIVLNDNLLHIDYRAEVNPSGNVPAWLYNLAVAKGPNETMQHLIERVEAKVF